MCFVKNHGHDIYLSTRRITDALELIGETEKNAPYSKEYERPNDS